MTDGPNPAIFREYDIRGTYGVSLFAGDAYAIGRACAVMLREMGGRRMAVGRDGRLSSPELEAALIDGLLDGGVDVRRIGVGPTPMLYFTEASSQDVDGGIHVTGSHNPRDDNGFKIVMGGRALFGAEIGRIGGIARALDARRIDIGICEAQDVLPAYVHRLLDGLESAPHEAMARMRIGWDAGNGAAGEVLEALVAQLPGEHHRLFVEIDGHFPHHHPDPSLDENLSDLRALVAGKHLDFGVALDGDGDRIVVVDRHGRSILGDQLLAILAQDLLLDHPGALILADVKSSQTVFDRIAALGGDARMAPAGHSLIKAAMHRNGALLAGETTGHIFYADRYYGYDDALYAALRLIAAVARSGRGVDAMLDSLPPVLATPELRFAVDPARKLGVVAEVAARLAAEGADVNMTDGLRVARPDGWWLLRASNTQDMLTARAEANDTDGLARLLAEIDAQLAHSGVTRA